MEETHSYELRVPKCRGGKGEGPCTVPFCRLDGSRCNERLRSLPLSNCFTFLDNCKSFGLCLSCVSSIVLLPEGHCFGVRRLPDCSGFISHTVSERFTECSRRFTEIPTPFSFQFDAAVMHAPPQSHNYICLYLILNASVSQWKTFSVLNKNRDVPFSSSNELDFKHLRATMRDLPRPCSTTEDIGSTGVAPTYFLAAGRTSPHDFFPHFCSLHFLFLIRIGPSMSYKYAYLANTTGFPSLSDRSVISDHSLKLQRTRSSAYYAKLQFHDQGQPEVGGRRCFDRR